MSTKQENNERPTPAWEKLEKMSPKLGVAWDLPKNEIWETMQERMGTTKPQGRSRSLMPAMARLAVAALLVVLVGTGALMRLYTQTERVPAAEHRQVELPDGSLVQVNAGSRLTFHPYWWAFSRRVKLEGEAYFEVKKGSRFEVESANGTTAVLGTSFNIYTRDARYRVVCLTGKVQVIPAGKTGFVILLPGEAAELLPSGLKKETGTVPRDIAWTHHKFVFTGEPIAEVFREIERQYGVTVTLGGGIDLVYSGNFDQTGDVREVLRYVCRPFNLKFTEEKTGAFRVERVKTN